jgi:O-antigen ligase
MKNQSEAAKNISTSSSNFLTKGRICRRVIEYGLLALMIFSPLPAASVYEWSILVIQLTVLLMMGAYLVMREKPQTNDLLSSSLKWPKYLFLGFFVFVLVQIIPFPKVLIKLLSSKAYSFQNFFSTDFSNRKFLSLSLIPSHTLQQGLELVSYFLLGFLIIKTITKRDQIIRFYSVLLVMGIFEAFYGLFELYNKNPRILFYKKIYHLDSVTGTFVNKSHFSGYLEMIIPLAIGLLLARINLFYMPGLKWREKLLRLSEKGLSTNLLISLAVIIMGIAIIFSKSRSGIFILIFSFLLFFVLIAPYFSGPFYQRKGIKNFLRVLFLVIIFISLYIGIGTTIRKFAPEKLLQEQRPTFWANTLSIISDFPVFGSGLGTFSSLYPDLYGEEGPVRLSHAHNDYLEYLSEIGIVGTIFLLGGIFFIIIKSFLVWRTRRHPEVKGLALGGIIAVMCILIHSITDFNLHIPANTLLFSGVLSLTLVTSFYKPSDKGR